MWNAVLCYVLNKTIKVICNRINKWLNIKNKLTFYVKKCNLQKYKNEKEKSLRTKKISSQTGISVIRLANGTIKEQLEYL